MIRIPVESSDIVSVGYDAQNRTLEIEFHGGRIYQYRNVDADIHAQLMRADSHGEYFNTFVHGRYRFDRMDASTPDAAPQSLAFVTGNARKFRDLQQLCANFDIAIEQLPLSIDEIQSQDSEAIAVRKAKDAYKLAGRPVVVNDAYWSILALRGFPGAYMADINNWLRVEDLLKLMEGKTERTVLCTDTLVYYDGKRSKVFTQDLTGTITLAPKGEGSIPIDRIVIMEGYSQTIAEIEQNEQRSSIDHTQSAWQDFAKWYKLQQRLGKV